MGRKAKPDGSVRAGSRLTFRAPAVINPAFTPPGDRIGASANDG